ncbi:MAG: uncharacterized protein JWM34_4564 [Ilumatobacteraceae bacterium]|nr:uncharacterized protein [Ilumatobacteraceae bacterium]
MQHRRRKVLASSALVAGLLLAACGSDKKTATTTAPTTAATTAASTAETTAASTAATTAGSTAETTAGSTATSDTTASSTAETTAGSTATSDTTATSGATGSGPLSSICPADIKIQTDWNPEAEHGFLYEMVGGDYTIDKDKFTVTGELTSKGVDQGVKISVLSGGPAIGFASVTSQLYADDSIMLGYVYTDEAIQNSEKFPTVAVESGFDKNPQMIMWDPATYPNVKTIADLGTAGVKIRYFGGAAYMDYFTSTGVLKAAQVDGSYDGTPALFLADEGKSAQQGFGSAEPYLYQNEIDGWKKPVAYQYINDAGWDNYAESIATKPANITKYADCLKALVPIIQQSTVDYLADPTAANKVILDAVAKFDNGWVYTQGTADYAVKTMKDDKLIANGPDGVIGKFDTTRVADLITKATPVYTAQDSPPKAGLTPADIVTNEFLDPSIGLK